MTSSSCIRLRQGGRSEVGLLSPPLQSRKLVDNMWTCYMKGCLFGLGFSHWHAWRGAREKQFKEKSENATHNSSVISFAAERWEEKPIRLGDVEYHLPSLFANRQTHRLAYRHSHTHSLAQLLNHTHCFK